MTLFTLLGHIYRHPLNQKRRIGATFDFAQWQMRSRLASGPVTYSWLDGTLISVDRDGTGFTQNIYCGLQDFAEMSYLLHVLRPGDLFVDVGANIGSYSLLASAVRHARSICFEPIPDTFARLRRNLALNHLDELVVARNQGVGDKAGIVNFSRDENCRNHVLRDDEKTPGLPVQVVTLDDMVGPSSPNVIKIDVEGFEWPVLKGARSILQKPELHSILLELNDSLYGFDPGDVVDLLANQGFIAYAYDPLARRFTPQPPVPGNLIFIRDLKRVEALVQTSESFRVKNTAI
jgi:FkbM family methyltransferase